MLDIRTFVYSGVLALAMVCGPAFAGTQTVTNTNDSGAGSLRAALASAASGDTIVFAPGVTGTIPLASTLSIAQAVTIQGPGAASLTLDGQATVRIVDIAVAGNLTLSGLTIANGMTTGLGGGIQNAGTLTVSNSIFTGNRAANGGGISNAAGGVLSVDACTFQSNTATSVGGGAFLSSGSATASNSTFVGNTAPVNGGAINVQPGGTLTLVNSTLFNNSSVSLGGGMSNLGTTSIFDSTIAGNHGSSGAAIATGNTNVTIDNSVFADNAAMAAPGAINGALGATSNNVFFNNTAAGTADDQTGYGTSNFIAATAEPLAPLGNNGGPTQTMPPLLGQAAICAGSIPLLPAGLTQDQRGFPRTSLVGSTPCLDAGAAQSQNPPTITNGPPPPGVIGVAYSFAYASTAAPAPTFTISAGNLPPGLSLSTTGVISGTPTAAGTFAGTVMAANGVVPNATQNFSIAIAPAPAAPAITSGVPPPGAVGAAYSFAVTATGVPAPTLSITGSLPTGLTFNSSSGIISGTPTVAGLFTVTITASNGVGANATQPFTIGISPLQLAAPIPTLSTWALMLLATLLGLTALVLGRRSAQRS